jgi:hypothetical protein|tara:strand:- start:786 stop:1121 length:336 start_codon:yes stop_codon:yes gene_type:complete
MHTNITEAFLEAMDFNFVKSIIRSNRNLKQLWGGKTPSRADLSRVIGNMVKRVCEHDEAEDCVNGIVVRKYSDLIRLDFLYLSYTYHSEESEQDNQEDSQSEPDLSEESSS